MKKIILIILRVIVSGILLQTLYFKFTAHPESVYIFTKVGMEPYGRIGSGIVELIAGLLILIPSTIGIGALISTGVISGAIFMHLTKLGIEVKGDGGQLFYMALVVFVSSLLVAWTYRRQIPLIKNLL